MEITKIMLAVHQNEAAAKIKHALIREGYIVSEVCSSGNEAIRRVREAAPDILLINFDLPDTTGLEVAQIVGNENLCSVIIMVTNAQRRYCEAFTKEYDITLLPKPLNKIVMLNTLDLVLQSRGRIKKLEQELEALKDSLVNRKLVEQAKGILMRKKCISEAEAYRRIQKMSMDSRVSMGDIAKKVIEYAQKTDREGESE